MHLWCRLLPQCTMTLNMLRHSRLNPRLSAYTQLEGNFDFNHTPLAPPGTKVIIHEKTSVRHSWAPHGVEGWYAVPALESYRCYKSHCTKTGQSRIADTVEFFSTNITKPGLTSAEIAIQAAQQLSKALSQPMPKTPFANIGQEQLDAIRQLSTIFQAVNNSNTTKPTHAFPPSQTPTVPTVPIPAVPRVPIPAVPRVPIPARPQIQMTPAPRVPASTDPIQETPHHIPYNHNEITNSHNTVTIHDLPNRLSSPSCKTLYMPIQW
jgi:hypothetical protein